MEDNDFELRDKMIGYIHDDLESLGHSDLCKINKYIRTKIVADLPNSEGSNLADSPASPVQQLQAKIRARVERFASLGHWQRDSDCINVFVSDLRELSAVQ